MSIGARVICWKDACSWLHHKQITAIQKAESALPCSKRLIHSYLSLTHTLSPFPGMRYPSLRYDETQTCLVYLYILCRARGDVEACSTWPGPNTQAYPERSTAPCPLSRFAPALTLMNGPLDPKHPDWREVMSTPGEHRRSVWAQRKFQALINWAETPRSPWPHIISAEEEENCETKSLIRAETVLCFKGIVHPKMNTPSSFTHTP